jgi:enoyl-CoA hydratase/carnithine racemase
MSSPEPLPMSEILFERRGEHDEVGWLTFNRPQARNALTWAMYKRLHEVFEEVNSDRSIRALVLTGAGQAFVAGTDISQFRTFETKEDALAYEEQGDRLYTALETVRVPTIAAIAGPCTGAGFGLAGCSDLRIGAPSARMGIPIARTLGNCLSIANYTRFSALMGPARLKEMIFLARLYGAGEALGIGLLNEVTAAEEGLHPRALELAQQVAAYAPLTLWATKEALRRINRNARPPEGSDIITTVYLSHDFKEGVEAFLAKRKPDWRGE